jgi:hypothetical protein
MIVGALMFLAVPAAADWFPDDGHKMHYPQLPDPFGWDVNFTWPKVLADDWLCSETGPVSDIHFWFSVRQDLDPREFFGGLHVSIHEDIPADPNDPTSYSMPGKLLWERDFDPTQLTFQLYGTGEQGWLDPNTGEAVRPDHVTYWQVNIVDILDPYYQERGTIYWLDLSVRDLIPGTQPVLGWKTTQDHWNDDAVWGDFLADGTVEAWHELRDPFTGESLDLAFVITPEPGTTAMLLGVGVMGLFAFARRRKT